MLRTILNFSLQPPSLLLTLSVFGHALLLDSELYIHTNLHAICLQAFIESAITCVNDEVNMSHVFHLRPVDSHHHQPYYSRRFNACL
ncbi:hypothetical protein BJ165DRAFT_1452673 [Panaeolus papilionaceus]|nr:hypothetical protein BJ165DRAFT_1452673 [Panaeolus papilionaceus]